MKIGTKFIYLILAGIALGCFALSPTARAVEPPSDGGYVNGNAADAADALHSNTTGSDTALANWIWKVTGRLNTARYLHTATLLQNGMVLVAGGLNDPDQTAVFASAELYDPANRTWTATGSLNAARFSHTATLLQNGTVLVAGGADALGFPASAELYDPASGTWTATGSLNTARTYHTATVLPDGTVLVEAGEDRNFTSSASVEVYELASGTWTATGSLHNARTFHTATLLQDGTVLVAGGFSTTNNHALSSAELGRGRR
jgi:Galactose oxidase, central domain